MMARIVLGVLALASVAACSSFTGTPNAEGSDDATDAGAAKKKTVGFCDDTDYCNEFASTNDLTKVGTFSGTADVVKGELQIVSFSSDKADQLTTPGLGKTQIHVETNLHYSGADDLEILGVTDTAQSEGITVHIVGDTISVRTFLGNEYESDAGTIVTTIAAGTMLDIVIDFDSDTRVYVVTVAPADSLADGKTIKQSAGGDWAGPFDVLVGPYRDTVADGTGPECQLDVDWLKVTTTL